MLNDNVVPEFVITELLFMVMVAADAVKLPVELLVKVPSILKFDAVVTVPAEAIVKLKKVGALPEVVIEEPLFRVMVPAVG